MNSSGISFVPSPTANLVGVAKKLLQVISLSGAIMLTLRALLFNKIKQTSSLLKGERPRFIAGLFFSQIREPIAAEPGLQIGPIAVRLEVMNRPPPYFPQNQLSPPDENRYKKFKIIVGAILFLVTLLLVGIGIGAYYLVGWMVSG
jgi:hypothetical protein